MSVVPASLEYNHIYQKKENCDMENDNLHTNSCSTKSEYNASPQYNSYLVPTTKKFAVIKKEICLRSSPPTEKIKSKIPFLRNFNIKFTKRENLDKKLVRKFRKFLKNYFQKHSVNMTDIDDSDFWGAFINEELYPPTKFRCLEDNAVYEFKSFNTNYMAWVFSVKNAERFYREFIRERGEEVFSSILKKNTRAINDFSQEEKNEIYEDLRYYISNLANIFNLNKVEENFEYMPASTPNKIGDIYDEMIELDVKAFFNEESHYNIKKKKTKIA